MSLTFVATYAFVGGGAASGYLAHRGEVGAAVTVALLALVALAVRLAWMTDWQPGRTAKRRAAALVTVMVVLTAVGGPVGTAAAIGPLSPVCTIMSLFGDANPCEESTEDKQTRLDLYSGGVSLGSTGDGYQSVASNLLTTSRAAAWTEGKIALVNALNNNSTEAEAQAEMESVIEDYYAQREHNIIQQVEKQIEYSLYAADVEQNETDSNGTWVRFEAGNVQYDWDNRSIVPGKEQRNVTLVNGSQRQITGWTFDPGISGVSTLQIIYHPNASGVSEWNPRDCPEGSDPNTDNQGIPLCIEMSDGQGNDSMALDMAGYSDQLVTARDQSTQLLANTDEYVSGVYSEYEAGDIDTSDLLSPSELASRASTDYNSTGYYSFAGAELAAIGVGGNMTTAVEVERNGSTYEGHIYSTGDGNQSWEAGESYQAGSGGNGVIYMASQNGSESEIRSWDSGNFTLTNATDTESGESVEVVNRTEYVYESTNSSALEEELNRTADLRAELEALEQQQGIGLPDIGLPDIGIPVLALAAAYLLFGRD